MSKPPVGPIAYLCGLLTVVFLLAGALSFILLLASALFRSLLK